MAETLQIQMNLFVPEPINAVVPIYYISDIHLASHALQQMDKENLVLRGHDMEQYMLDFSVALGKKMGKTVPVRGAMVLFCGDIASCYLEAEAFYTAFMDELRYRHEGIVWTEGKTVSFDDDPSRTRVYAVLGNHELWGFRSWQECSLIQNLRLFGQQSYPNIASCKRVYAQLFHKCGIIFLDNDRHVVTFDGKHKVYLFGGTGFAGRNHAFNADSGIYRYTVSRRQEMAQSRLCDKAYNEMQAERAKEPEQDDVLAFCVTHHPLGDWKSFAHTDAATVYFHGHTHSNGRMVNPEERVWVFADNQIGYDKEDVTFASVRMIFA